MKEYQYHHIIFYVKTKLLSDSSQLTEVSSRSFDCIFLQISATIEPIKIKTIGILKYEVLYSFQTIKDVKLLFKYLKLWKLKIYIFKVIRTFKSGQAIQSY